MLLRALVTVTAACVCTTLAGPAADAMTIQSVDSQVDRHLKDTRITESSGLARSTYARSALWTHNDSGGVPVVFAVSSTGDTLSTVTLTGARALDWEDIASGPGGKIWVGDVGNNKKTRSTVQVYAFTEPEKLTAEASVPATRYELAYADGRHNSETIMVHPTTGRLYVVTKSQTGTAAVYVAPARLSTTSINTLTRLNAVPDKITGGAFSPDGSWFTLGNYTTAWLYRDFTSPTAAVKKPGMAMSESLEVSRGGNSLLAGSEGDRSPVYRMSLPSGY